jgi:glyoxylase-like metal-dependent hydrolase (beta-lactamase superfamily II)
MTLHTIDTGHFKLDGGAMFGVVPKSIWSRLNPADENNLCSWAMRCLLIEEGNRLMLVDTGMGDKQDAKFFSYYYPHGEGHLLGSIRKAGFSPEDITDVLLTHLHFDHCGGAVYHGADGKLQLTFPRATYWSNEAHWHWATQPNAREKASFLRENILPIQESGQLKFWSSDNDGSFANLNLLQVDGHTEKMMLPKLRYKDQTLVYLADLIPSVAHVPIPYVMGYDVRPLLTMEEKTRLLTEAADGGYLLLFEHDPVYECATVEHTEKGVRVAQKGKLKDFIGE